MPDGQSIPEAGHNNPPHFRPDVVEAHTKKASEFLDAAGDWLSNGPITSETSAQELVDFIDGIRKVKTAADDDRKADKKPHDEAGKAVQTAYKPIIEKLSLAIERVTPLLNKWIAHKEAEQRAAAQRAKEEAEKARIEAERKAQQAQSRDDVNGEYEAEQAMKEAEELQKQAERVEKAKVNVSSASGAARTMARRKTRKAKITNLRLLFMHYMERPEVTALLEQLANADIRSTEVDESTIPGIEIIES